MSSNQGNTPYRDLLTASIYWIILVIFLYSYFQTRNPLSLSVATDRVVDALSISFIFLVNRIARKPADEYHSFGFHRVEVILNATVILLFMDSFPGSWHTGNLEYKPEYRPAHVNNKHLLSLCILLFLSETSFFASSSASAPTSLAVKLPIFSSLPHFLAFLHPFHG